MAIWQFKLDLIPISAIRAKLGGVPSSIPEELAEDVAWWAEVQPPAAFELRIGDILSKTVSWSDDVLIWGDERGDTASVCYDDDRKVEWIGFRVDVREISQLLVRRICDLAKELECVFLTDTNHLIPPLEESVVAVIAHSTAQEFVDDPASTLRRLRDQGRLLRG